MDGKEYRAALPDILTEEVDVPHWVDGEPNEYVMRVADDLLKKLSEPAMLGETIKAVIPIGSSYRGYPEKTGSESDLDFALIRHTKHKHILLGVDQFKNFAREEEGIGKKKIQIKEFNINPLALREAFKAPTKELYHLLGYMCLTGVGQQKTNSDGSSVDGLQEARATVRAIFADPQYSLEDRTEWCNNIAGSIFSDERHFESQSKLARRTGTHGHDFFNPIAGSAYLARRAAWRKRIARVYELRISDIEKQPKG